VKAFSDFLEGDWKDQTMEKFVDIVEVYFISNTKLNEKWISGL